MYKIGEFSKMTLLTIKALRYYHEQDILVPSVIDEHNGYRSYSIQQVELARSIKMLRDLEFSVKEIKEIFDMIDDLEDLPYYMTEKFNQIESEIARLEVIKKRIVQAGKKRKEVMNMNEYEVIKKQLDEAQVISIRYKGRYDECGSYISKLYKVAKGAQKDVPFNIYYDEGYEEIADIEVCLPVKKEVVSKEVAFKNIPAVQVLSVIHIGPYDQVGGAYEAISKYAKDNGINLVGPTREIYRKGPGMLFKGNPNKYVTEVIIPIKL